MLEINITVRFDKTITIWGGQHENGVKILVQEHNIGAFALLKIRWVLRTGNILQVRVHD